MKSPHESPASNIFTIASRLCFCSCAKNFHQQASKRRGQHTRAHATENAAAHAPQPLQSLGNSAATRATLSLPGCRMLRDEHMKRGETLCAPLGECAMCCTLYGVCSTLCSVTCVSWDVCDVLYALCSMLCAVSCTVASLQLESVGTYIVKATDCNV